MIKLFKHTSLVKSIVIGFSALELAFHLHIFIVVMLSKYLTFTLKHILVCRRVDLLRDWLKSLQRLVMRPHSFAPF